MLEVESITYVTARRRCILRKDDLAVIVRAFPPGSDRPAFDVPRFWSNTSLQDPDTIITLVLTRPTSEDLARTVVAYKLERVLHVLERLETEGELTPEKGERVADWLRPIMQGVADAARELTAA